MVTDTLTKGPLLLRNLREAVEMTKRCEDTCNDFEKHQPPGMVHEWKMMKHRWEIDPSQPDPFQVIEKGEPVAHTNSSTLTLGLCSFKSRFREAKVCRD